MAILFLKLEVAVVHFVPWQTLFVEFCHKWVWVEFFYVVHSGFVPQAKGKHACPDTCWHSCGIADSLHAGFLLGGLM